MVICSVVVLTAKALSLSARLTQAATSWIHTGRSRAATAPQGRGVLRLRLQQLHLLETPQVVMPSRSAPKRTSTSSRRSRGRVKRPCRTGGGLIFADNSKRSCAAREEAVQSELEKKLVELQLEKKLVEHRQISRASPFCYVIDIFC